MAMQETQSASSLTVADVEEGMKKIQDHICSFLVKITGQQFREDRWNFEKGKGGGISRIWEGPFDDNASIQPFVLEKGIVSVYLDDLADLINQEESTSVESKELTFLSVLWQVK